ncbi:MAG: PKD domain-containing protein, partial [Chitinophagaceae bacterium]
MKTLLLLLCINLCVTLNARNYYVSSASGNNTNTGTSTAAPWQTIAKVNSTTFAAGDSIFFKRGEVWTGNLIASNSGVSGNPIVYSAYGNGKLPEIINGSDFWTPSISLTDRQYVVIDGFKLVDNRMSPTDHSIPANFAYGIRVTNSPNCTIKNCDISLVGNGINVSGTSTNTTITGNYMHNLRMVVNTQGGDDDYGANPMIIATSNNTITNNRFEECWANSYDYGYDGGAIELFGSAVNNNTIMYNTAINCNGFLEIGSGSGGTANNNIVAYNKIINCGVIGIFNNAGNFTVSINNLQYYNNTIVETLQQYTVPGVMFDMFVNGTTGMVVLKNNIFYTSNGTNIFTSEFAGSVATRTNNFYRMTNGSVGITLSSTEILNSTSTLFTSTSGDPSIWNYALPVGSPAINFGTNAGYTKDFIGNPIIGNPDAGILEFVNAATNNPPTANAGNDIVLTLPANSTTLTGSGTDADGTIVSYAWSHVSGPATFTLATANAASTALSNLVQGTYTFRLTVTDNSGTIATDDVTVTVNATPNQAPTANAGNNIVLTLPTNATTLTGSGTDADGTIVSFAWSRVNGPTTFTLGTPNAATTTLTNLVQGIYVFRLTVRDNASATGTDDVTVTVNAAPVVNQPPVANAGNNIVLTLPTNSTNLAGSGTDADGTITSYAWTRVSGPTTFTMGSPNAATTTLTNLIQGTYVFRLTVTDNGGATATDDKTVTVNAAPVVNQPPTANAGNDIVLTLPTNSTNLTGSGTDADGTIASYAWTRVSGPTTFTIGSPNAATTTFTNLVQGTYVLRLT